MRNYVTLSLIALVGVAGAGVFMTPHAQAATTATADNTPAAHPGGWNGNGGPNGGPNGGMMRKPGVFGTVSAINGSTLTVTSKMPMKPSSSIGNTTGGNTSGTAMTYTVDASNATVTKDNTTSTLSAIAVGDTIMVQGTVTGTNVAATTIRDGVMPRAGGNGGANGSGITGDGNPVVGGTVSSVSGSSLTITNTSNVTYTVDASNATIEKMGTTSEMSAIANGDRVLVQGTVNGQSVAATSVIDQGAATANGAKGGIFAGIGSFFKKLFGFF